MIVPLARQGLEAETGGALPFGVLARAELLSGLRQLLASVRQRDLGIGAKRQQFLLAVEPIFDSPELAAVREFGRASCRERVCQYVSISVVAVSLQKKINKQNTIQI